MVEMTYDVEVSREGNSWLADVRGLPGAHTHAGNLTALYDNVYEVIALVNDDSSDVDRPPLRLHFMNGTDELLAEGAKVGEERESAEAAILAVQQASQAIAARMAAAGYSVRDIAGVLRLTPGRVSQILAEHRSLVG
jgi:predicted RNase H-like HicB family nuclease